MGAALAALVAGLQDHRPLGHNVGRCQVGDLAVQGCQQGLHRGGRLERLGRLTCEVLLSLLLEPFRSLGGFHGEQCVEVEGRGSAVRLGRLDGNAPSLGDFQVEAHHRLVHAADLLDIERAVTQAFAVENEQLFQHAIDHAVGDAGNSGQWPVASC